jgi:hypothetical protein
MSHYDKDYAVFDEFGLLKLLCMRCGTTIAERRYAPVPSAVDPSKTIMAAIGPIKNSSYREVAVELSDGSYTNLKLCKGCENETIDTEKAVGQILRAHEKESAHVGLGNDKAHKEVGERWKKMKVIGRLSQQQKDKISEGGK